MAAIGYVQDMCRYAECQMSMSVTVVETGWSSRVQIYRIIPCNVHQHPGVHDLEHCAHVPWGGEMTISVLRRYVRRPGVCVVSSLALTELYTTLAD